MRKKEKEGRKKGEKEKENWEERTGRMQEENMYGSEERKEIRGKIWEERRRKNKRERMKRKEKRGVIKKRC